MQNLTDKMQFHIGYFGRVITFGRSTDQETVALKAAKSRQPFRETANRITCTHFTPSLLYLILISYQSFLLAETKQKLEGYRYVDIVHMARVLHR